MIVASGVVNKDMMILSMGMIVASDVDNKDKMIF